MQENCTTRVIEYLSSCCTSAVSVGCGGSFTQLAVVAALHLYTCVSTMALELSNLDEHIERLRAGDTLTENEVKALCEKVRKE
jgi:hypothetical protein